MPTLRAFKGSTYHANGLRMDLMSKALQNPLEISDQQGCPREAQDLWGLCQMGTHFSAMRKPVKQWAVVRMH